MSWQGGRQLASMQKDGTSLSFAYNDAGLRTEKTVNGSTRRYVWNSGRLVADMGTADAFYFRYSSGGEMIGYTYKTADAETECILVKNQQGDVERVISADGTILASYTYDAWGNVLTAEGSLAASNPIRYRGCYFDAETNLYYLQSRYYDSATGRFINADNYASTGQGICGCNMFAYCENSPIARIDFSGAFWETAFDVISLGASIVEVCVNPRDPWAWAGLVGDAVDLIPFVTGVGETTRAIKTTIRVVDNASEVVDSAKILYRTAETTSDLRRATGSYEILFESGKNYVGKGGFYRAITSASRNSSKYGDNVLAILWKSAPDNTSAFIDEYLMQLRFGGVLSSDLDLLTYNKIWSPGKRYFDLW